MKHFFLATIIAALASINQGCQSCCAPHDYDRPVADCHCQGCGECGGRAGSNLSGSYGPVSDEQYIEGDYSDGAISVEQQSMPSAEGEMTTEMPLVE